MNVLPSYLYAGKQGNVTQVSRGSQVINVFIRQSTFH